MINADVRPTLFSLVTLVSLSNVSVAVLRRSKVRYRYSENVADNLGSLNDKTMRLPMDSPVFAKLQDIIESSARSPQWCV
jgi:hypothetical protein